MKRLALALLLACSPSTDPPDGGAPTGVSMQLDDTQVVVVRGQSASIHLSVFEEDALTPLHLSLGTLPDGLSSGDVDWNPGDPSRVVLDVTAAPDAPDAEISFTVTATADGAIAASESGVLSVSNLVGSIDPTFGQNGVTHLDNLGLSVNIVAMKQLGDGRWLLAGYSSPGGPQVFPLLLRLLADGSVDSTFGQSGVLTIDLGDGVAIATVQSAAVAPDDRIAFGLQRANDTVLVTLDATGNVLTKAQTAAVPIALAWDGNDVFVGTGAEIDRFVGATNSSSVTTPFSLSAMHSSGPGAVVAFGRQPTGLARFVASGNGVIADGSYGTAGFLSLPLSETGLALTPIDVDGSGRTIVALDTLQIARVSAGGALDATWAQGGLATLLSGAELEPFWLQGLSSGATVIVGELASLEGFITMLDPSGSATPFGTYGRTLLCPTCAPEAAAVDASEKRGCVAAKSNTEGTSVTCYRLSP